VIFPLDFRDCRAETEALNPISDTANQNVLNNQGRIEPSSGINFRYVDGLHPRVVSMLVGWWFPEKPGPEHGAFESNINTIISNDPPYDPINGNHQARAILCRIGKVE
jgi:hypothetical protein